MKTLVLALFLLSSFQPFFSFSGNTSVETISKDLSTPKLLKKKVLNGKASILIPEGFARMTSAQLSQKYAPGPNQPKEVYTNKKMSTNIVIKDTGKPFRNEDIPKLIPLLKKQFQTQGIQNVKSSVSKIDGKNVAILKFFSPTQDVDLYNLFTFRVEKGILIGINFNCLKSEKEKWNASAEKIVSSFKMN